MATAAKRRVAQYREGVDERGLLDHRRQLRRYTRDENPAFGHNCLSRPAATTLSLADRKETSTLSQPFAAGHGRGMSGKTRLGVHSLDLGLLSHVAAESRAPAARTFQ